MFRTPIPPIPPIDISRIISVGKRVFKAIKNLFVDDETRKQAPLTQHSELSEVANLNGILFEYRNQVKQVANELEREITDECMEVFHKIISIFEAANESYEIYRVDRLRRKFDRMAESISGTFERYVAKRISLDDVECSEILKMLPGELKGERMQNLKKKVFIEAVEDIVGKLNEAVEELLEDIEDAINLRLNMIKNQLEEKTLAYESITCTTQEKENHNEKVQLSAIFSLGNIQVIEELVEEY